MCELSGGILLYTESLLCVMTFYVITSDKGATMKNGLEDYYVIRGNKKMRFGYINRFRAAAAAGAQQKYS